LSAPSVLSIKGLVKTYRTGAWFARSATVAVDHLNLEVFRGEIFGMLGPNGAGKTTTLNLVVGVAAPEKGTIEIFGEPFRVGDIRPLKRLGYVPETTYLPEYFTVSELLDFYGRLFGMSRQRVKEQAKNLLERFGLDGERRTLLKNLSMGQRRLIDIIQALLHEPELLLLDEPTVYLDPVALDRLRLILLDLKRQGKTVIMSSHMLPEIERLSDRLAVLHRGRCLKVGLKSEFVTAGSIEPEFMRLVRLG
jgi:ABC-2 type transport system ATP-binding protein